MKERRSEKLVVILTPREKAVARQLAGPESLAAFVRVLIRREARDLGLWPPAGQQAPQAQAVPHA